jgi:hypothetical protein
LAWKTPQQEGQRPRKYYRPTGEGIRVARLSWRRLPPVVRVRAAALAARQVTSRRVVYEKATSRSISI